MPDFCYHAKNVAPYVFWIWARFSSFVSFLTFGSGKVLAETSQYDTHYNFFSMSSHFFHCARHRLCWLLVMYQVFLKATVEQCAWSKKSVSLEVTGSSGVIVSKTPSTRYEVISTQ